MIRNDSEYKKAVDRLKDEGLRLQTARERLEEQGLKEDEIKRVMYPLQSFHLQLEEEVKSYEKLKRAEFDEIINLRGAGHLLVCLRIARGMTQKQLADKLGVHETQVSRDERNEYHGITLDRASRIFEALGTPLHSKVKFPYNQKVA
jgi:DNA-binding Xre family transcriptional regulator